jgi:hypothetical protein
MISFIMEQQICRCDFGKCNYPRVAFASAFIAHAGEGLRARQLCLAAHSANDRLTSKPVITVLPIKLGMIAKRGLVGSLQK